MLRPVRADELLSIFTAQQFNSVLAYLEKPSTILYVYAYFNDPKKHSHHMDIRNINNNNNNNNNNDDDDDDDDDDNDIDNNNTK